VVNVVPNSDFILTRVAHKNNQSEYRLNRKQAKREEVVELLKSKGVDLDNSRFLILQVCFIAVVT
jgi:structural maintenance of chromosome 4